MQSCSRLRVHLLNFFTHALFVPGVRVFFEIQVGESATFLRLGEPDEEEGEGGLREEIFFRGTRVLVHCVADRGEWHARIGKEFIVSVMSVCQD